MEIIIAIKEHFHFFFFTFFQRIKEGAKERGGGREEKQNMEDLPEDPNKCGF